MPSPAYPSNRTAYLLVDPYNDFLSEGGKVWPRIESVAKDVDLLANLRALDRVLRTRGIPVFFVPHRRWEPGDYENWDHPNPNQRLVMHGHHFARGEWGGDWHPDLSPKDGDFIATEHWGSSGFANTNLDFLLKQKGITHVIVAGLLANTCIECTARFASELGYHVTLIRDATAALSPEMMHAAHAINGPTYAHSIVTTYELIASLH